MTPESLVPDEARHAGIEFCDLCAELVELAFTRRPMSRMSAASPLAMQAAVLPGTPQFAIDATRRSPSAPEPARLRHRG